MIDLFFFFVCFVFFFCGLSTRYNGGNVSATIGVSFSLVLGYGHVPTADVHVHGPIRPVHVPRLSSSNVVVRDVWDRENVPGNFKSDGHYNSVVESHATRLLLVTEGPGTEV